MCRAVLRSKPQVQRWSPAEQLIGWAHYFWTGTEETSKDISVGFGPRMTVKQLGASSMQIVGKLNTLVLLALSMGFWGEQMPKEKRHWFNVRVQSF